ncbi:MAG: LptE family protein [Phycisphaeraceae bacterium]|nr:MAG: LptE family protein [Phycisphaeraceae bacterium]
MIRALIVATLAIAPLLALPGCASDPHKGYVLGSTYDKGVRTIAVPIFDNTTYTPGLEQTLTEALVKRLQTDTPWRIADRDAADTVLTGVIDDARLDVLTRTPATGLVQEQVLTLRVSFTWRDNRTGDVRVRRERFSVASSFTPARGAAGEPGERIEVGQRAAIDEMARAIVAELRADF